MSEKSIVDPNKSYFRRRGKELLGSHQVCAIRLAGLVSYGPSTAPTGGLVLGPARWILHQCTTLPRHLSLTLTTTNWPWHRTVLMGLYCAKLCSTRYCPGQTTSSTRIIFIYHQLSKQPLAT